MLSAIKPTKFVTPDGVERELRFTLGVHKRIRDHFGMNLKEVLDKYGDGAIPAVLFAMLHGPDQRPPEGITIPYLEENLSPADSLELMGLIVEASTNGAIEKKVAMQAINKAMEALTGSGFGASPVNGSDSATTSSGGSPGESSTLSSSDTGSGNGPSSCEPEPSGP